MEELAYEQIQTASQQLPFQLVELKIEEFKCEIKRKGKRECVVPTCGTADNV